MCILIKFSIVEINQFVLNLFYIRLQLFDILAVYSIRNALGQPTPIPEATCPTLGQLGTQFFFS